MSWYSINPQNKSIKYRILIAAQDPGGANAIVPVVKRLIEDGRVDVIVVGAYWANSIFRSEGLSMINIPELQEKGILSWALLEACANTIIATYPVQALLVGTSWGPSIEKVLTRLARLRGIPSMALLDAWMNYVERFSDSHDDCCLTYLPDRVAIMDEFAKREMLQLGFPENRLVVTGQPAFDKLLFLAKQVDAFQVKKDLLQRLSLRVDAQIVLFISQSFSVFYGDPQSAIEHLGYNENIVLLDVVKTIETLKSSYLQSLTLVVKAHPKEDKGELERVLKNAGSLARVLIDEDYRKLLISADVVIGMSSNLLVESYMLGIPTISYQPGLCINDQFILTRAGILERVNNIEQLKDNLCAVLRGELQREPMPEDLQSFGSCTERVVNEIYNLLGF